MTVNTRKGNEDMERKGSLREDTSKSSTGSSSKSVPPKKPDTSSSKKSR